MIKAEIEQIRVSTQVAAISSAESLVCVPVRTAEFGGIVGADVLLSDNMGSGDLVDCSTVSAGVAVYGPMVGCSAVGAEVAVYAPMVGGQLLSPPSSSSSSVTFVGAEVGVSSLSSAGIM